MTPAEKAIDRLHAMFGEPKTPNPEQFLVEYQKALGGIEDSVLDPAIDRVMRKATFWPRPAEVLEEVNKVAAEKYRHRAIDWDAVEADRKAGWRFSDLARARSPEARAMAQALVDEFKRNLAANRFDGGEGDPNAPDWRRGQRDGFREMQRNSPNNRMHMKRAAP